MNNSTGFVTMLMVCMALGFAFFISAKMDSRNIDMLVIFGGLGFLAFSITVGLGLIFMMSNRRQRAPKQPTYNILPDYGTPNQIEMKPDNLGTWHSNGNVQIANEREWS